MTDYQRSLRYRYYALIVAGAAAGSSVAHRANQKRVVLGAVGAVAGALAGIPVLARSVGPDDEYTRS